MQTYKGENLKDGINTLRDFLNDRLFKYSFVMVK